MVLLSEPRSANVRSLRKPLCTVARLAMLGQACSPTAAYDAREEREFGHADVPTPRA